METQQQQFAQPQPTPPTSNSYQIFGIISLILGILAFLFSFIPCFGVYALFPGILGIIAGIVGLLMAGRVSGKKVMAIAGLALSVLGSAIACYQYRNMHKAINDITTTLKDTAKWRELRDSINSAVPDVDTTNFNSKISIDTTESR